MKSQLQFWWKKIKEYSVSYIVILVAVIGVIALIIVIILGYYFDWDWTGFGPYMPPNSNYQRGKTLWDWINLLGVLAIPLAVGFGTVWFTKQQAKESAMLNEDSQREAALQDYIDKMSELLLKERLRECIPTLSVDSKFLLKGGKIKSEDEVSTVARARTLTVLSRLDKRRKRSVLEFLHESGLIEKNRCIINLSEADLHGADLSSVNLEGADLKKANFREADLSVANFREANLGGANLFKASPFAANLSGANLSGAFLESALLSVANLRRANLTNTDFTNADLSYTNLSGADLTNADLLGANLSEADLREANLTNTNLFRANLSNTKVTLEQLEKAKSLKGATMPDGSKHT